MKKTDFTIQKNILDLEHSEKLSRGITQISIGIGGFISIISFMLNRDYIVAIVLAFIFAMMFLIDGIKKLNECHKIRDRIKNLHSNY